jgi:hypothetical protein
MKISKAEKFDAKKNPYQKTIRKRECLIDNRHFKREKSNETAGKKIEIRGRGWGIGFRKR